jgi:ABC-type branched-subunit amino acid transport system ATPase component
VSSGLVARGITVRYGAHTAVDQVSATVEPGRIVGLIGPNGAGKTSFIDAVTGLTAMAAGEVVLDGEDITSWSAHRRALAGMRRTFQGNRLFDDLTVSENLIVAAERDSRWGFLRDLFRPRRTSVEIDRALELTGLTELAETLPRDLSAGTRRLVGVARGLVARPHVLLLDEPAAGLDTHETEELGEVLVRLAASGVGLLLVEHDTNLVFRVCHDVVAIDFGRTIASGPSAEVRSAEAVVAAYLGTPEDDPAHVHLDEDADLATVVDDIAGSRRDPEEGRS